MTITGSTNNHFTFKVLNCNVPDYWNLNAVMEPMLVSVQNVTEICVQNIQVIKDFMLHYPSVD
jgi:hypothetical protein